MGLKPRSPSEDDEPGGYVSTITTQELNKYHAAEYADGYPSDEDAEEDEEYIDERRRDKTSIATKLSSAVKNFSLPSPEDIKNSNFYKSFQQPLMVKTKVQKPKVLEANQAVTADKTPAELSRISKLSEFPLPTLRRLEDKETEGEEKMTNGVDDPNDISFDGFGYNSLPRSLRETKLITTVKESDPDDAKLIQRMETTKNMTPAQLAEIKSIRDFPIPNKIKSLLDKPAKGPMTNGHASSASVAKNDDIDGEKETKNFFTLPEGFMDTKIMTNIKECTDYDTLKKRKELTETKSPKELSAITGISDFPVPTRLENLMKKHEDAVDGEEAAPPKEFNLDTIKNMEFSVPPSFKIELAVSSVVEDEELARQHKELVETKSVAELSKLNSVTDFPIPDTIENILKKKDNPTDPEAIKASNLSLAAITSGKILPESLRETKLVTNIKVEKDQEKLIARQSIVKNQTPMELGSIKNLQDFPIPSPLQRLQLPAAFSRSSSKKSLNNIDTTDSPRAPPRQKSCNASIYESLPSSLRNEVIVRSRPITDEESKSRQELIRSKSPVELSQISSLKEFPVPKPIENLLNKPEGEDARDGEFEPQADFIEKYATLPSSMKTSLLVGVTTEDQDLVSERAETVKAKSVHELSEIKSLNDIPIPSTLSRLAKKDYAPVERKKLFKMQMKSASLQSLSLQGTLPRSLREKQLLVSAKVEDPDVISERKAVVESKSVAELSKVSSLADFPVPTFLSKLASRSLTKLNSLSTGQLSSEPTESKSTSGIYSTLPKSLNCELLVSRSVQDISVLEERMQLINEKSTKELASIRSYKDFPVPDAVQKIYHKSMDRLHNRPSSMVDGEAGSIVSGQSMPSLKLPAMLTQPCIVTTKVEDPQVLLERQQIQQQKSIHELSKIRNLNEFPVPGNLITLPDVPIPKMKDMLQVIARTPTRKSSKAAGQPAAPAATEETESNLESSQLEEDEYSNLDQMEDSYEVISKEPTESPQVEVEPFGLATQVRGTPERSTRSKKKKPEPRNRRSQEEKEEQRVVDTVTPTPPNTAVEEFETPPPLPPKRSPQKSMSVESQQSVEMEGSPAPVRGVLTLEAMNGNIQVIKKESAPVSDGIQSRPLPAPPAPVRYGRVKDSAAAASTNNAASAAADRTLMEESQKFQTCRESLTTTQSRTLLGTDEDDNTMADSIVESLVSCTDTLICDDETDPDDDPYPSVNFEGGMSELVDTPQQGKRLEEGTQQLSQELMNHVESLKSTLDNMSTRLGARSRSRSSSRPRSTSRTRLMGLHQDKL